jgi:hypothetical protein
MLDAAGDDADLDVSFGGLPGPWTGGERRRRQSARASRTAAALIANDGIRKVLLTWIRSRRSTEPRSSAALASRATLTLRRRLLRAALTLPRRLDAALSGSLAAEYERQRRDAGGRRCGSPQLEIAHERNYTIATAGPEF